MASGRGLLGRKVLFMSVFTPLQLVITARVSWDVP
ncbi:uncharacterized protein G2W53_005165 [Senna tora]|uniref:Uncharacterized protein n=1 Tax=Senna tora TaxID=362788 RepID=A0A835CKY5_9FABA|nr:uncharacterized protein G2W53_005165 [Senna tora]